MKKLATFLIMVPIAAFLALRLAAVLLGYSSIEALVFAQGPLVTIAILAAGFSVTSYLLGLITGDLSWVDRMWSTVPVLYAWIYASAAGFDTRTTIVAALVGLWGARLTYNFARRGGYTTIEDYRWPVLRARIKNAVLWQLFSLFFISIYQNSLFVLFTLPLYALSIAAGGAAGPAFWAGVLAFLLFLVYETVADQQQYDFQQSKAAGEVDGPHADDIRRGFRTTGLFRLSRHPNYFGELMIWWMVYQMGTTAVGTVVHWTGMGAVLLSLLFIGSTVFTESISRRKYEEYDQYRETTSAIVPLPRRSGRTAEQTRQIS